MSAHKSIDKICVIVTVITLVITVIFCNGKAFGIEKSAHAIGYENRLFDHSKVHTIDIVMNDWDGFIEKAESEEYSACNLVIDGEAVKNVGIRGKGNTSLSSVKNMDSSRYSFKIEFDQYENGKTYHGLDKLCLNNIIQDNTYMKDYLAYTLMYDFSVDAPLCSYAYITVNGEDWGLYLAVEAVEDSFLERNYGSNYGDLYKPDAMSFGGGRGNGKDFSMSDFMEENSDDEESEDSDDTASTSKPSGGMPNFGGGDFDPSQMFGGDMSDFGGGNFDPSQMFGGEMPDFGNGEMPDFSSGDFDMSKMPGGGNGGFGGFGMGSDDVKLKYTDDDIESYSNIFNNAKTTVTTADQKRLIKALKNLTEQSDLNDTVDVDEVIRYFVVHNFLCNGDSYTGQMIHNYYLYEKNGQLSMIPWDYNLAYGSFMGGNASSSVNSPIDTPVSNGMSDRPMIAWIFSSEEYTEQYHKLFSEFLSDVDFVKLISETAALIDEYVQKDPTKFCTYDEFKTGVEAVSKFCTLREESVSGQLSGSIPSTTEGQNTDSSALIDCGDLNTSDMGSMGGGMGGFGGGQNNGFSKKGFSRSDSDTETNTDSRKYGSGKPDMSQESFSKSSAEKTSSKSAGTNGVQLTKLSEKQGRSGGRPDFGGEMPDFNGEMPSDFDPSQMFGGEMPEGFEPGNMPGGDFLGGFGKDDKSGSNDKTDESSTEAASSEKTGDKTTSQTGTSKSSRPQMGDFSPNGSTTDKSHETQYILLGISGIVLLAGLIFALIFRR